MAYDRRIDHLVHRREGFCVQDLLDAREVARLAACVRAVLPHEGDGFFASPAHAWQTDAEQFHRAALEVARPAFERCLPGYEIFLLAATVKHRGGPVQYHQDWTYTDERVSRPIFAWVPLVDVDERNGALRVVPRTHRRSEDTIRPSRGLTAPQVTEPHQAWFESHAVAQPLAAGQALFFDPATVHGSHENRTDDVRLAFTAALVPSGTPLVHFHEAPDGTLTGHRVDPAFFRQHPYAHRPEGYPPVQPWTRAIRVDDLGPVSQRCAP